MPPVGVHHRRGWRSHLGAGARDHIPGKETDSKCDSYPMRLPKKTNGEVKDYEFAHRFNFKIQENLRCCFASVVTYGTYFIRFFAVPKGLGAPRWQLLHRGRDPSTIRRLTPGRLFKMKK